MDKRKLENLLDKLQMRINCRGYKYWIKLVELYLTDDSKNMQYYYKKIAQIHNTTIHGVERCIRFAYEKKRDFIQKYFEIDYKISTSTLLALIVREMKRTDE